MVDLHRHLEGSLRPATVAELTGRGEEETRALIQLDAPVADLVTYLRCNEHAVEAILDLEICERVAAEAVEDAAAEGLERLELRFSPLFMSRPHGLDAAAVVEAVVSGVRSAERDHGLPTAVIGIMSRTFGPEGLGAERIGHGVRAVEDPRVVELLAEREIPLEVSLTSNIQTRTAASYAEHPLKQLMSQGVLAAITTDNPTASATTLSRELAEAAPAAGLSPSQIAAARRTAAERAFA